MRVIDLEINKALYDEVDALIMETLKDFDHFWYQFPFTKQNVITMLWLCNTYNASGYRAWIDGEIINVERQKEA